MKWPDLEEAGENECACVWRSLDWLPPIGHVGVSESWPILAHEVEDEEEEPEEEAGEGEEEEEEVARKWRIHSA